MTIWDILKRSTYVKTAVAYIWATFGKIWLYFPKSGHTGLHICVNYSIFGNLQQWQYDQYRKMLVKVGSKFYHVLNDHLEHFQTLS